MVQKKKSIKKRLIHHYRLVLLDDDVFEEKLSFKINRLNVFIAFGVLSLLSFIFSFLLFKYTPLKYYFADDINMSKNNTQELKQLQIKVDSLETDYEIREFYLKNLQAILNGKTIEDLNPTNIKLDSLPENISAETKASDAEQKLKKIVEDEDQYNLLPKKNAENILLIKPVDGVITSKFNLRENHFGIDIACQTGAPIKAPGDAKVIFAEWTGENGNVIILQHASNIISIYKHNASLFKNVGDIVSAGEVIAFGGSSGSLSKGPHLHLEIWMDGFPINPELYLNY